MIPSFQALVFLLDSVERFIGCLFVFFHPDDAVAFQMQQYSRSGLSVRHVFWHVKLFAIVRVDDGIVALEPV
jgi:hypothetical protein